MKILTEIRPKFRYVSDVGHIDEKCYIVERITNCELGDGAKGNPEVLSDNYVSIYMMFPT